MKRFAKIWMATLTLLWMHAVAADVAIRNVELHTMVSAQPLQNATLLVQQGRVSAFGPDVSIPAGVQVIDGTGMVVTPGLVEPHSQIGLEEISAVTSSVDSRSGEQAAGPAFDIQYAVNADSTLLPINVVEGVTHAVTAPAQGQDIFAGLAAGIVLAGERTVVQPQLALFGAVDARAAANLGGSRAEVVASLRRALTDVRSFRPSRYEPQAGQYSKVAMQALAMVRKRSLPVVLHVDRANEILQVLRIAKEFELPIIIRGAAEGWKVAKQLAAANVPVIVDPMNNLPDGFDRLGARADNPALLHAAGVKVAFSVSDSHNARQLRQLAGNAVAAGMPWSAALRAITLAPAEMFGLNAGRIEVGQAATLVLWQDDPLDVTSWPQAVMVDGQWVEANSRQTRLFQRYRDLAVGKETGFTYR